MCTFFTDNKSSWNKSENIEHPPCLSCDILYFQLGIMYLLPYKVMAAREINVNISLL